MTRQTVVYFSGSSTPFAVPEDDIKHLLRIARRAVPLASDYRGNYWPNPNGTPFLSLATLLDVGNAPVAPDLPAEFGNAPMPPSDAQPTAPFGGMRPNDVAAAPHDPMFDEVQPAAPAPEEPFVYDRLRSSTARDPDDDIAF
jgi:hypothetical protein